MCVAIPVKIKSIQGTMAQVEIGGVERQISVQLTPEAKTDDYVLVHAGFAINVIDEQEALETMKLFEELGAMGEEEIVAGGSRGQVKAPFSWPFELFSGGK